MKNLGGGGGGGQIGCIMGDEQVVYVSKKTVNGEKLPCISSSNLRPIWWEFIKNKRIEKGKKDAVLNKYRERKKVPS